MSMRLDGVLHLHVGFGDGLTEGIEVDADHVDEFNAVLLERRHVRRVVAAGQQTAVHLGMERLHAAVADFRETRHVADVDYLHTALAEQLHGAARGDDLPAEAPQPPGKIDHAGLVAYAD